MADRCFACGKLLKGRTYWADTRDAQIVRIGRDCAKRIQAADEAGYQPKAGPRLYPMQRVQGRARFVFRTVAHDDAVEQEYRSWQREVEAMIASEDY